MPAYPRSSQRRPLEAASGLALPKPETLEAGSDRRPAARPAPRTIGRAIPRFVVVPDATTAGSATSTGAHRFPTAPTPVLQSSIGLLGHESVSAACRPWRRGGRSYRFARLPADAAAPQEVRELSSARFPKV